MNQSDFHYLRGEIGFLMRLTHKVAVSLQRYDIRLSIETESLNPHCLDPLTDEEWDQYRAGFENLQKLYESLPDRDIPTC